jgi:BASS family bile acid:Na+ symporter
MDPSIARDILLPIAILLVVFGIGLELSVSDFRRVLRDRRTLLIGTALQVLVFPLVALPAMAYLGLPTNVAAGFVLLAACPSGGFSNILAFIARANVALSISLTAISTLLAVVTMPAVLFLARGGDVLAVPMDVVIGQLVVTVALPVCGGIFVRARWPRLVEQYGKPYGTAANIFIYVLVAWMFYQTGMAPFAGFTLAFFVSLGLFAVAMAAAYLLAIASGAEIDDAFTIAIEASIRNMGLATLVALSTLGRPDLIASPTAYFFGCALLGVVAALVFKSYRRRVTV